MIRRLHANIEAVAPPTQRSGLATVLFVGMLVGATLVKLVIIGSGQFDLSFDEAYYWLWSQRLDWCYFSKGPGIALAISGATALLGNHDWAIRLVAVGSSTAISIIAFRWSRRFFHADRPALVLAAMVLATPLFVVGGLLTTIDAPLMFCWTLALAMSWRAFERDCLIDWVGVGLAIAAGALCKFTAYFLLASLVGFAVVSPLDRRHWRRPGLYLALGIGLLAMAPIVVWNVHHDWVTFRHTADKATSETSAGLSLRFVLPSLGEQLLLLSPVLGVGVLWSMLRLTGDAWRTAPSAGGIERRRALFLWMFSAPILGFYAALAFHRPVAGNWTAAGYAALLPAAAYYWSTARDRLSRWSLPVGLAVGLLCLAPLCIGDRLYDAQVFERLSAAGFKIKPTADVTNRLKGYRELSLTVAQQVRQLEAETQAPVFVLTDHYSFAAWIGYYGQMPDQVFVMPRSSVQNQFHLWAQQGRVPPQGASAVIVYDEEKGGNRPEPFFESVTEIPERVLTRRGQTVVRRFVMFIGHGHRGNLADPYDSSAQVAGGPVHGN